MENYHNLMDRTYQTGVDQKNLRTGKICRVRVGEQVEYDMADGFPAITSKKLAFKNARGEQLGFFRGYDNAADFRALGCGVWDDNANKTVGWLNNPHRKGTDDLGRIYGVQWTKWRDRRVATSLAEKEAMEAKGYEVEVADTTNHRYAMIKHINQLEKVLRQLLTDPTDRRMIVTAWNPAELDMMALPPCHVDYRFVALEESNTLSVVMTIRSWDLFLGAPFNICNTALFLCIMARLSGFTPGKIVIQATNAHIYMEDHEEQVKEQLTRGHYEPPQLYLSDRIKKVTLDEVEGAFARIEPEDIDLIGYQSHPAIKAEMAA